MRKDEAIRIITDCAKLYHANLENRNLLFIFGDNNKFDFFESLFLPRHYMHLTGIKPLSRSIRSSDFYNLCLKGQLPASFFTFQENGTTEMKLSVLSRIVNIHKTAKMVGDYDYTKSLLITEKIVGTVTACLGFVRDGEYYAPNTILREDVRDVTIKPQSKVLAVLSKTINEKQYTFYTYLATGVSKDIAQTSDNLRFKISLS